ncbi:MAG: DUF4339 domain-containing protein, partial [Planctomycetales bacterium]|nr:DUF4339 domain-containing protein [Planctomycetales bacterium]
MAQWYYSQGDQQVGPVSDAEVKQLLADGKLKSSDEVWREGLDDWAPVGSLPELGGEQPIAPPPAPRGRQTARGANLALGTLVSQWSQAQPMRLLRPAGHWLLAAGLLLVITARGCDALGQRSVARAKAKAQSAPADFDHDVETARSRLEVEREEINAQTEISDRNLDRLERIDELLAEQKSDSEDDRKRLARTTWRSLDHAAKQAQSSAQMWAYWHELAFVLGSFTLVAGLLTVGVNGNRAERWLCLAMLAVIVYS